MTSVLDDLQKRILTLKANGHTTASISTHTRLSSSTIDNLMGVVYARLGARNCPQAVAIALKRKEIDEADIIDQGQPA